MNIFDALNLNNSIFEITRTNTEAEKNRLRNAIISICFPCSFPPVKTIKILNPQKVHINTKTGSDINVI